MFWVFREAKYWTIFFPVVQFAAVETIFFRILVNLLIQILLSFIVAHETFPRLLFLVLLRTFLRRNLSSQLGFSLACARSAYLRVLRQSVRQFIHFVIHHKLLKNLISQGVTARWSQLWTHFVILWRKFPVHWCITLFLDMLFDWRSILHLGVQHFAWCRDSNYTWMLTEYFSTVSLACGQI